MGSELTVRQKILTAALAVGDEAETFTVEDLIVRAWGLFPESFSLRGYEGRHPDSNRVLAKLSGADGLCGLGWLEHTDQRTYKVTRKGRAVLKQLQTLREVNAVEVTPSVVAASVSVSVARTSPRAVRAESSAKESAVAEPVAKPSRASRSVKTVSAPRVELSTLTDLEVQSIQQVARAEALRKFLRGSPLTFADACGFWGFSTSSRPAVVQQRLELTADVLKRAVESFGAGVTDARLPPLSTCYGLFNLHRLMVERFAREIESLKLPMVVG